MARAACPFLVSWNPSRTVAAFAASPGIPSNMAVIEPPVKPTLASAISKGMASMLFNLKAKGRKRAIPSSAPIPGSIPNIRPQITPSNIHSHIQGSAKLPRARTNAEIDSNIACYFFTIKGCIGYIAYDNSSTRKLIQITLLNSDILIHHGFNFIHRKCLSFL